MQQQWSGAIFVADAAHIDFVAFFIVWDMDRYFICPGRNDAVQKQAVVYSLITWNTTSYCWHWLGLLHGRVTSQKQCSVLGGHHSISRGGDGVFVTGKLFISTGLGCALKISHFITSLNRTVLEVNSLFHATSARNYLFQKHFCPPPPWKSNGDPLSRLVICIMVKNDN